MKTTEKKLTQYFLTTLILIGASYCNEKQEWSPSTPIYSEINEIIQVGGTTELSAKILRGGNSKIIEYGFLIAQDQDPAFIPYKAIKVSITGDIKDNFTMTANLEEPSMYSARAYIKSKTGHYYSPVIEFFYTGSSIETSMEITSPKYVYFGDSVRVKFNSTDLSKSQYYAEINGTSAEIVQIEDNYFKFTIPDSINFNLEQDLGNIPPYNDDGIIIRIAYMTKDGLITKHKRFNFTEPIFYNVYDTIPEFPLDENWVIKGDFMKDAFIKVKITDANEYLEIVSATDTLITVKPSEGLDAEHPSFTIYIRGKEYVNNFLTYDQGDGWF
ncbi:hypothetical protein [Algoriphagus chordae]|uniref:Uncharacterized protein n=1 Tax=Algoriphagus chordae TaxID=237019 RepID=A0A2W7RDS0_9BACT|nr:hypothetical protein [Algoriphagus chordae]PZX48895.1 hypothetical protein LV85_03385 [Algoriphagus chordae]